MPDAITPRNTAVQGTAPVVRKTNRNNTTGYTGVSWAPSREQYQAYISFDRKQHHLGFFDTLEAAVDARLDAEEEVCMGVFQHRSFARAKT